MTATPTTSPSGSPTSGPTTVPTCNGVPDPPGCDGATCATSLSHVCPARCDMCKTVAPSSAPQPAPTCNAVSCDVRHVHRLAHRSPHCADQLTDRIAGSRSYQRFPWELPNAGSYTWANCNAFGVAYEQTHAGADAGAFDAGAHGLAHAVPDRSAFPYADTDTDEGANTVADERAYEGTLDVVNFETSTADKLNVAGVDHSGSVVFLQGTPVDINAAVSWTSDIFGFATQKGWKVCLTMPGSPSSSPATSAPLSAPG
eukprot:gene58059-biopygen52059